MAGDSHWGRSHKTVFWRLLRESLIQVNKKIFTVDMIKCRDKIQSKTNSFLIVKSKAASECKTAICIQIFKEFRFMGRPTRKNPALEECFLKRTTLEIKFITKAHLIIRFYSHCFPIETSLFIVSIFTHATDRN